MLFFWIVACVPPVCLLIGMSFLTSEQRYGAVAMLVVSGIFEGANGSSYHVSFIDMAPK